MAMFSLASGDRNSCEMSCSSREYYRPIAPLARGLDHQQPVIDLRWAENSVAANEEMPRASGVRLRADVDVAQVSRLSKA